MAKVRFKGPVASFSGKVGDFVYALQPDGSVNVRKSPKKPETRSAGQLNQQDRVRQAAAYWRSVKAEPAKLAVYLALPRVPGLGPRHFAARDFFNAPVIGDIEVSGYTGGVGQPIRIQASDDTAVAGLAVQIVDMQEVALEEGAAKRDGTSDWWVYLSTKSLPAGQTVSIRVTATDHPGNRTAKSCFGYTR